MPSALSSARYYFMVFLSLRAAILAALVQERCAQIAEDGSCATQPLSMRQVEDETSMLQTSQLLTKVVRAHAFGTDEFNRSSSWNVQRSSSSEPYRQTLINTDDVQYYATLQVGGQEIAGILDTGSFELLVFSKECASCGNPDHGYNRTASATYSPGRLVATHSFGSGDCDSEEGFETVEIGPYSATHLDFWEVREARMPVLSAVDFQAIVGVGPPNVPGDEARQAADEAQADIDAWTNASKQAPAHLEQHFKELAEIAEYTESQPTLLDALGMTRFSVCFQRRTGSDGYWIWNDADPRQQPHVFTALPVAGTTTWGLRLQSAQLSQKPGASLSGLQLGCEDGCGAIIDTGTSLLAVPPTVIEKVSAAMDRLHEDCSNLEELPDLSFLIEGQAFTLPPDAYVGQLVGIVPDQIRDIMPKGQSTVHRCDILLMAQDSQTQFGPLWILGMPFFRHYYTTFDLGTSKLDRNIFVAPADAHCSRPESPALLGANASSVTEARQGLRRVRAEKLRIPPWAVQARGGKFMPI